MPRRSPLEVARELEEHNARQSNPPALSQVSVLAMEVAANRFKLLAEAEQIIRDHLDEIPLDRWPGPLRNYFNPEELAVFDALNLSKEDLAKEVGRLASVRRWQDEAGTSAERRAASERVEQAQAALDDEERGEAKLTQQIQQLQSQVAAMQRERRAAAAAVESQERAVAELRKLVPSHVIERVERLKHGVVPQRTIAGNLQGRLAGIAKIKAIDVSGIDGKRVANLVAYNECPEAMREMGDPASPFLALEPWQRYLTRLDQEATEKQAQLPPLLQAISEADQAEQAARDFYLR